MTRSNAREIAVHFVFELGFSGDTAQELLDRALTREAFALLGEEEELYAEFPNAKQYNYISDLVRGVFDRGVELDRDQLMKANKLYLDNCLGGRDDAVGMQYLIPGWKFDNKRPCMVR